MFSYTMLCSKPLFSENCLESEDLSVIFFVWFKFEMAASRQFEFICNCHNLIHMKSNSQM